MVTIRCKNFTFEGIEAVLFDKDGTLANSEAYLRSLAQRRSRLIDAQIPGVQEPLLLAFGIEGVRINPAGLMAVGTRRENEIAAAAYVAETGKDWIEALQIVQSAFQEADRYGAEKAKNTPLIPGSRELIQRLSNAGLKLAILSSDSIEQVTAFVNLFDLKSYFLTARGVDEQFLEKSDPDLLAQIFATLKVQPEKILMIGDSRLDAQIARDIGMAGFIGFLSGWSSLVVIPGVELTIHDFAEIEIF